MQPCWSPHRMPVHSMIDLSEVPDNLYAIVVLLHAPYSEGTMMSEILDTETHQDLASWQFHTRSKIALSEATISAVILQHKMNTHMPTFMLEAIAYPKCQLPHNVRVLCSEAYQGPFSLQVLPYECCLISIPRTVCTTTLALALSVFIRYFKPQRMTES